MSRLANEQKLVDEAVDSFVDMMTKKFSRRDFKLIISESRVKNINFTIFKNRFYFSLMQVDELFECLNKTVDVVYQYYSRKSSFFVILNIHVLNFYRKLLINTPYHFVIFRYDHLSFSDRKNAYSLKGTRMQICKSTYKFMSI